MKQRMENRVKCLIVSLLFMLVAFAGIYKPVTVHATSATLTFTADKKTVTVGDTFYVVIVLDSSESIGGFEGYVTYDSNLVEFVTGGSFVNGGDGLLRIYDMDSAEPATTKKYSLEFKAKKTGDCLFDTSDAPAIYSEDGEELSVSSNKLTVSVSNSESLSKNNKLKKLLISPGELNQEYSNDITAYKTEVPYDCEMLFISAEPSEDDAVVTIEGNEELQVGSNYVHVIVTAPSGAKRDIQIEVTRLEEAESEQESQETQETPETGISIFTNEDEQKVILTSHMYQIAKLNDAEEIPSGYEESSITIEGQEIQAYVNSLDTGSEFLLLYLTNENGETDFYQFDRVEKTIQRYQPKAALEQNATDDLQNVDNSNITKPYLIMIGAMGGLIIILLAALTVTVLKHKK